MADNLPPELLFDILTRLHPYDVTRCMCVSKAWNASIRDPRFIKVHHLHSIKTNSCRTILLQALTNVFNFLWLPLYENDTLGIAIAESESSSRFRGSDNVIIGCSNGLVCVRSYDGGLLALWNPSIKKIKKIPSKAFELLQPSSRTKTRKRVVVAHYGFGYDSTNDDYKVAETVEFHGSNKVVESCEVNIYSLISNSWKKIESMPCNVNGFDIDSEAAVCLNNSLCWRLSYPLEGVRSTILSLDLVSEKYKYYEVPIPIQYSIWTLRLLGDYLCICHYNHAVPRRYNIWIMKEFGVTNSWTLLFSVESLGSIYIKPLMFSKSGEMVLLEMYYKLVWFHLEEKSVKVEPVEIGDTPDTCMSTVCEGLGSLRLLLDGDPLTAGIKATEDDEKAAEYVH